MVSKKSPVSHKASRGKKIKLVQIIAEKDVLGGGPKHVLGILENIDQSKFDPFLICPRGKLTEKVKRIKKIETINVEMDSKFNLSTILRIKKELSKIQASGHPFASMIVHTHGPRAGLLGREALKQGMISVYTEHIWGPGYRLDDRLNEWLQKRMLKKLNYRTHLIIAVSNAVRKYLVDERLAPKERIVVIPNGITMSNVKCQMSKLRSRIYDNQIIGTVGNLSWAKGQIYLIRAVPEVIKKFPHATLEIVGEGEERENLQNEIRDLKLTRHITLLGKRTDIKSIMKKWTVFVLPSRAETFGISILEAYAAGIPVVASKVGGVADLVTDQKNGLLVAPESETAIAEAVIELLEHPVLAAKLVRGGRERVKDFEWGKVIEKLEKEYVRLAISNLKS